MIAVSLAVSCAVLLDEDDQVHEVLQFFIGFLVVVVFLINGVSGSIVAVSLFVPWAISLALARGCGLTMPLCRHSVGTYQETSSHATRQETLGHSRLCSLSHCGLILAYTVELVCLS